MDEKKISNAEVREILEKQLQLLSERSHQIANNTERGKELPLLTEAMIKLAVILSLKSNPVSNPTPKGGGL